ncbi:hypothetical protein AYO48_03565 [Gaiella sp. SCGC AG-212-M14]|nr:hypothetical protein AYO48_03565 [Gaiella sp. SCGC AG-212-M14]
MEKFVAVAICALLTAPASGASNSPHAGGLLQRAARLSGLHVHHAVRTATLPAGRYDQLLRRARNRDYPPALRSSDSILYARLGLTQSSERATLMPTQTASRAWYDPSARKLLLRRTPTARRSAVLNELVRALVDQNFNLRRLAGLYARDRDRALAAKGIVDGTAALASGLRARPASGTALERFLTSESAARLTGGRQLAAQLRYLGGGAALASALRAFPQTTEQLLHVDKFLERERALPVRLPARVGDLKLTTAETFGELDLRSLLQTFRVRNAATIAEGWGGGRLALYTSPAGETVAVLSLRWDTFDDATEWRDAVPGYAAAAFPDATAHDCPPLDRCWSSASWTVAAGTLGDAALMASGPGSESVAAAILAQG